MAATETLEILYKLKKEILKSENDVLVSQIDHAIMKTYKDQLVFSFIGHYSAGKSSLINHMLNQDILPSSPVPTTSNTVSVEIGDSEEIKAFVDQYRYIPLENYEALRKLNTRDLDITSISMNVPHALFRERTVFQDTPGVDSNTSSHGESANRFLLNSDYIFFTVEYNHVESEHNMKLLKEIAELDIPFSLIINQIDKHDDRELTMETFLSRIRRTLDQWNIIPEHIFTTSIYDSPYNEINQVTKHIAEIEGAREAYESAYHGRIIKNIEDRQLQYLRDAEADLRGQLDISGHPSRDEVEAHLAYLEREVENSEIARLHEDPEALRAHVQKALKDIVANSYMYPHQVKSVITDFLKVLAGEIQPGGLFGKRKKARMLYEEHKEKIGQEIAPVLQTEINAPVNGMFDSLGLEGTPFKYEWNPGVLIEEEITSLSSNYVMNYLDKLKREIESDITAKALDHLESLEAGHLEQKDTDAHLAEEIGLYKSLGEVLDLKASLETDNYRHFYIHLDDEMDRLKLTEPITHDFGDAEPDRKHYSDSDGPAEADEMDTPYFGRLARMLDGHPRYGAFRTIIKDKLERIENGQVNISVFGGFSAGKTTFINALMGEARLTTSPNPTTATITEIADGERSHALYKTEADLVQSLEIITNRQGGSVNDFLPWIRKHKKTVKEAYIPFLTGIETHYDRHRDHLGTDVDMPTSELIDMISADEEAIFIHKAFLSIRNDLTDKFSIIDSPGINSINERHTKETHNILSASDMIIYVSYYNHVFSRSDERFLQYIKSIKGEDFPVIFIVNAVDLMKSESDLEKVLDYIRSSLGQLEIKNRIFPLSAKQALENGDERFDHAKEEIISLAHRNASKIQYQSLKETGEQLKHSIAGNMKRYHNQYEEQAHIESVREDLTAALDQFTAQSVAPTLHQELDIILSHVEKQLTLKLYDYLKALVSSSDMRNRKFIAENRTFLTNSINQHLSLELATSFNAIYHKADRELAQNIRKLNEALKEAQTAHHIETVQVDRPQPEAKIDPDRLLDFQKPLHQAKNQPRDFRTLLLDMAKALVQSMDEEAMASEMTHMVDGYLENTDQKMQGELESIQEALKEPLPEISDAEYEEDRKLNQAIENLEVVEA
ncbi:dynamin family protein [Salinicoccus bachuensis]|uniref:Dynamin family protein n=1 Tax=Salinicoccus bachuensis TaxID=3136731 RepID=A0ABZ3CEY1_9STAP